MQGTHKSKKSSKYRCLKISNFSFVIDEKKKVHRLLRHTSFFVLPTNGWKFASPDKSTSAVKGFDKRGNLQTVPPTQGSEFIQVDRNIYGLLLPCHCLQYQKDVCKDKKRRYGLAY